jgi:hypothetical protein
MKKVINAVRFTAIFAFVGILTQSFTVNSGTPTSEITPSVNLGMTVQSSEIRNPQPDMDIMVPAGTSVSVRLHGNYNSDDYEIGNNLRFIVSDPVVVDGQVVIAQGSPAEGEITNIKRMDSCSECPSKFQFIEIAVTRAKAVDGSYINLYGKPHAVRGKCPTCPVTLNQGINIEATVQSTIRVKVR